MHGVGEQHCFVVGQRLQQRLVGIDEGLLFGRVELARHRLGLAVFQPQTMQQRDQSGAALVDDPERLLDPRSDLAGVRGKVSPIHTFSVACCSKLNGLARRRS
ncbi:hypothetical protein N826_10885 [Skermanella aerolata KACC 11604]|nr:hypothetical protein N826_10885 [Skermanella aerolata KACC 11604]